MSFYHMIVTYHKIMDRGTQGRADHAARAGCKCKLQLPKGTDSNDVGAADRFEAALVASCASAAAAKRRRQSTEICESGSCILHHARFLFVPPSRSRVSHYDLQCIEENPLLGGSEKNEFAVQIQHARGWRVRHVIMHSAAISGEYPGMAVKHLSPSP